MELTEAQKMAHDMMVEYSVQHIPFEFDRGVKRFGAAYIRRARQGRQTIAALPVKLTLSAPLTKLNTPEVVRGVLLHEIAHLLTPGHNHDAVWKRKFQAMGGDGARCYASTDAGGEVVQPPMKWTGTCPNGHVMHRARMTERAMRGSCAKCDPRYNAAYSFTWKENK